MSGVALRASPCWTNPADSRACTTFSMCRTPGCAAIPVTRRCGSSVDDLKQPVSEMLAATYGISGERVSQQLADVAGKLVADYWDNNSGDIRAIVDGSLLMDYDEAGVEMQFKSAAAISVTYTLLERCGL